MSGHVLRVSEHSEPHPCALAHSAAAVVAAAGAPSVPPAPLPQRRLHDVPAPPHAALGAAPLRRVPSLVPVRLAAGAPRRAAARLAGSLRRQALRVRAVRTELQVQVRLRQTPRTKPPRPTPGRQTVHMRCLRYAVPLSKIVQKTSPQPHPRTSSH